MSDHSSSSQHSSSSGQSRFRRSRKDSRHNQTDSSFVSISSGSEVKTSVAAPVSKKTASASASSTKSGKRHHRRRHKEIPAAVYEGQKEEIVRINSLNLTLETDTVKRKALFFTVAIILAGAILFFFEYRSGSYEGGRLNLIGHIVFLMFLFWIMVWEACYYSRKIISLKTLIQFQETRVDSLKAALAHHEKKIQELTEANEASQTWSKARDESHHSPTGLP